MPPSILGWRPREPSPALAPADHCQTSSAFGLHSLPPGSQYVASSREGMQTNQTAAIPAILQADRLKGVPDAPGKLGEWVSVG